MFLKNGQLVYHTPLRNQGNFTLLNKVNGFGIIVDIIDQHNNSFCEMDIITGQGLENSNVKIVIDIIAIPSTNNWWNSSPIEIPPTRFYTDPNNIIVLDFEDLYINIDFQIEELKFKKQFFQKYEFTRDDKINIILNKD